MSYDLFIDPPKCYCGHSRYKHYVVSEQWVNGHYEPVTPKYGKCKVSKCPCWKYIPQEQKGQVTR